MWQAYDDTATLGGVFKVLEGFEGLLERATIAADIRRRSAALLTNLSIELRRVCAQPARECLPEQAGFEQAAPDAHRLAVLCYSCTSCRHTPSCMQLRAALCLP